MMMSSTVSYSQSSAESYEWATSPSNMYLCTAGDALSSAHFHDLDGFDDVDVMGMEVDLSALLPAEGPIVTSTRDVPTLNDTPATEDSASPATPADEIRDSELEVVYEQLEDEAMMEILEDLQDSPELRDAYFAATAPPASSQPQQPTPAEEHLLWNLFATPTMMADLATRVRMQPAVAPTTIEVR